MKPLHVLAIVVSLVLLGEALADFLARNPAWIIGLAIAGLSGLIIYSVRNADNNAKQ